MFSKQKLSQIFKNAQHDQKGKMTAQVAVKLIKQIGLNMYEPKIRSLIYTINNNEQEESEKYKLTSDGFVLLAQLINEPLNKQIWQYTVQIKEYLKQIKKELNQRDLSTRDREMEGKIKIKIGPQQQFKNIIKAQLQIPKTKKITVPWINFHFTVKQEGKKQLLAKIVKQILQTVLKFIGNQKPQFEKGLSQISIQTHQTQTGVKAVLQIRNEKIDELQQVIGSFMKQLLQTEVNGKIQFEMKTNFNLLNFIDKNKQAHFFNILERDCQISLQWSASRIMTAIKELIIQTQLCIDLQYDKVNPAALTIISLVNTENLNCEIQFQNTMSLQENLELVNARNQLISNVSNMEGVNEIFEQFHINQLLEVLGDQIKIYASFSTVNILLQIKLQQFAQFLKQLFGIQGGQNRQSNSQMNEEKSSDND